MANSESLSSSRRSMSVPRPGSGSGSTLAGSSRFSHLLDSASRRQPANGAIDRVLKVCVGARVWWLDRTPVRMRGAPDRQLAMLTTLSTEDLIPADHPIRRIRAVVDVVLADLDGAFDAMYAAGGWPAARKTSSSAGLSRQRRAWSPERSKTAPPWLPSPMNPILMLMQVRVDAVALRQIGSGLS